MTNNTFISFAAPDDGGPGVFGFAGIFNPVLSGVDVYIDKLSPWSSNFPGIVVNQWNQLGGVVMGGQNKRRQTDPNANQPKGKVYWHLSSVAVGYGLTEYYCPSGVENGSVTLVGKPIILTPGTGIYVTGNAGDEISVQFEWTEEPISEMAMEVLEEQPAASLPPLVKSRERTNSDAKTARLLSPISMSTEK